MIFSTFSFDDGGAVARRDADAVHLDAALRRNEIAVAFGAELVLGDVAGFQRGAEHAGGALIGSASPSPAKPLASGTKRPERSDLGNGLAPQDGSPPPRFRLDPDLEDLGRHRLAVVLRVADA